jgi:tetratricopeptide (TPR) repeat protein
MSGSDRDDKTGVFKNLETRVSEKLVQVQMSSGKIYGPYARDEVLNFIESKKIRGEEKILFEGETLWRPIATEPEFFDAIHAILSGKPIKRKPKPSSESFSAIDDRDKTRASGSPKGTQTEFLVQGTHQDKTRFTDSGGESAPPIWTPPIVHTPTPETPGTLPTTQTKSAESKSGPRQTPKKSAGGLVLVVLAVVGVGIYLTQNSKNAKDATPEASSYSFEALTARIYARPLSLALKELRVPLNEVIPADVQKTNLLPGFVYSLNARRTVARLNASFDNRAQPEAKTSSYWAQRSIDLQLLGLGVQVVNLRAGEALLRQGQVLWKELEARKFINEGDKNLWELLRAHALGDWESVNKLAALVTSTHGAWIDSDAVWWASWQKGVKRSPPALSGDGDFAGDLEVIQKIRLAYFSDDPQMSTWLLQLASIEPESPYLWFSSAQIHWRKSQNVQVQNAYRDFIIGLGSLSLYPPSLQIAYWTQFADFLRSYARAETHKHSEDNLGLLRNGDIGFKDGKTPLWWDLGDEGLIAKDIADEILARSSKGMLNARDRAALEVLGSNLNEGSRYLFVVGTHLAFEGQWTEALHVFKEILLRDPRNVDGLFGKVWALAKLFRFSEAQDTYKELVRASLGSTGHLRSKALIHFLGREYIEAHRIFNDYLKQDPTDGWAHYFRAETFLAQDSFLSCIKSANLAKLHSKGELQFRAEQLFYRCRVKGGVGIRDSLDSIARLIKDNPDNLPLRISYIELLNESHLYVDAVRVLDDSLRLFPFSAKLKIAGGNLYDSQGNPGRAIDNYTQAARLDPSLADPWVRVGKSLQKQDKFIEAAKNFETAARIQPTYPEIYLFAARAYDQAGRIEEAAYNYTKEIELRPAAVGTFVEAAEFLLKNNAPQKIPELYRQFQSGGFEEDPRALTRLAIAYNVMGNIENAKSFASRAVAGNPDNPYANLILADILDRAGDYNLAKRYYESYLKLMPLAQDASSLRERLSKPPYTN